MKQKCGARSAASRGPLAHRSALARSGMFAIANLLTVQSAQYVGRSPSPGALGRPLTGAVCALVARRKNKDLHDALTKHFSDAQKQLEEQSAEYEYEYEYQDVYTYEYVDESGDGDGASGKREDHR